MYTDVNLDMPAKTVTSSILFEQVPLCDEMYIISPDLLIAYQQWRKQKRDHGCCEVSDTLNQAFYPILRRIVITKIIDWKNHKLEVLHCGSHVADFMNNGERLDYDEMARKSEHSDNYKEVMKRFDRIIQDNQPEYMVKKMNWLNLDKVRYEVLILPYTTDGVVTHLVSAMHFKIFPDLTH